MNKDELFETLSQCPSLVLLNQRSLTAKEKYCTDLCNKCLLKRFRVPWRRGAYYLLLIATALQAHPLHSQ